MTSLLFHTPGVPGFRPHGGGTNCAKRGWGASPWWSGDVKSWMSRETTSSDPHRSPCGLIQKSGKPLCCHIQQTESSGRPHHGHWPRSVKQDVSLCWWMLMVLTTNWHSIRTSHYPQMVRFWAWIPTPIPRHHATMPRQSFASPVLTLLLDIPWVSRT